MLRTTPFATLAAGAAVLAAALMSSPADAKPKNFFFLKNGQMSSFKAYKLYKNPPLYKALHQIFGLGPQWGPTMYIPVPSGSDPQNAGSSPSRSYDCYDRES
jgi:hypothetical protein